MPTGDEIQRYFSGVWRLMRGHADGVRLLDISADGFWNSFFAIVVALPALFVDWVATANAGGIAAADFAGRLSIVLRLGVIDLVAWVVPLLFLGLVARVAGIADRYVHFVVASNWATALLSWAMAPVSILALLMPGRGPVLDTIMLAAFIAILVLVWRMTNAVLARGAGVASAVFALVFVLSLVLTFLLYFLLGLDSLLQPAA